MTTPLDHPHASTLARIEANVMRRILEADPPIPLEEDMRQVLLEVRRYASFGRIEHMDEVRRVLARYEREQIERQEQLAADRALADAAGRRAAASALDIDPSCGF